MRLHLSPPTDDRVRIAMDLQARDNMITSASAGAAIAEQFSSGHLVEACATVGTAEPITLRGTAVDPSRGLAAYCRFPLSDTLARRIVAGPSAGDADPGDPGPVERAGNRTMAASHVVGRLSNAFHVVGGDLNSLPRPDELPITTVVVAPPAEHAAAGTTTHAGAPGLPVASPRVDETPAPAAVHTEEWPELGGVWSSATGGTSAGLHVGTGPGKPAKGWLLASSGGISGGVQASLYAGDTLQKLQTTGGVGLATPFGAMLGPAASGAPVPLDIDVALCIKSSPVFHATMLFESAKRELTVAYQHHVTFRRAIYNPLEEGHVKGIFNYVDVGAEFRQPLVRGRDASVAVAGAWQMNRHLLVKAKAGTAGAAVSAVARGWGSPDLCLTASMGVAPPPQGSLLRQPGTPYAGVFVSLGNAAAPATYRKLVLGEQQMAKYRQFTAQPGLSSSKSSVIEANSTQAGPARSRHVPVILLDDDGIMPGRTPTRA